MVALGGVAVSYERGTPVGESGWGGLGEGLGEERRVLERRAQLSCVRVHLQGLRFVSIRLLEGFKVVPIRLLPSRTLTPTNLETYQ